MVSTKSIVLSAVQIFLLLDYLSVQSASIDRIPENSDIIFNVRVTPSQRSNCKDNLSTAGNDSFSKYGNTSSSSTTNTLRPNITVVPVNESESEDKILFVTLPPIQDHSGKSHISRSAQKCIEYRNIDANMTRHRTCLPPTRKTRGLQTEIIIAGGRDPKRNTFSHVVALGRQNEDKEFVLHCGGTLVSPSWVLTAAHCTHGAAGGIKTALLGIRRLNDTNGVTIPINRTIRHPSYKPPALYADIALLKLERPVTFSKKIKPACLHQPLNYIPEIAWVTGWGATEFSGSESNRLQEAKLNILHNEECAMRHNHSVPVPNGIQLSMICAGAPNNNWEQDTCQGDSGGPLQIVHSQWPCLRQIIGITSFGSGCAFVDSPGVYTRVSHYLDWIENIVWPLGS